MHFLIWRESEPWFPSVFRVRKGEGPAEEPGTEQLGEGEERCYVPEDKLRKGSG